MLNVMTKRMLAGVLAVTMTLTAAPPQPPPPVIAKKSRKAMWIAIGATAAVAIVAGAVLAKRIGNER